MTTQSQDTLLERIRAFDTTPREVPIGQTPTTLIRFRAGRWVVVEPLIPGRSIFVGPSIIPVGATPAELERILTFLDPPVVMAGLKPALDEAETLIRGALESVLSNDPESALWRLVDAAGIVAQVTEDDARGQEGQPTGRGRGFFIGGGRRLASTHRRQ